MALLNPSLVSSDRFTVTDDGRASDGGVLMVAELSDLGREFRFGRVWDDACDVGLTIVSTRTGRQVVFAIEHEERDREGELLWIDLLPANRADRGTARVRLYND